MWQLIFMTKFHIGGCVTIAKNTHTHTDKFRQFNSMHLDFTDETLSESHDEKQSFRELIIMVI